MIELSVPAQGLEILYDPGARRTPMHVNVINGRTFPYAWAVYPGDRFHTRSDGLFVLQEHRYYELRVQRELLAIAFAWASWPERAICGPLLGDTVVDVDFWMRESLEQRYEDLPTSRETEWVSSDDLGV